MPVDEFKSGEDCWNHGQDNGVEIGRAALKKDEASSLGGGVQVHAPQRGPDARSTSLALTLRQYVLFWTTINLIFIRSHVGVFNRPEHSIFPGEKQEVCRKMFLLLRENAGKITPRRTENVERNNISSPATSSNLYMKKTFYVTFGPRHALASLKRWSLSVS